MAERDSRGAATPPAEALQHRQPRRCNTASRSTAAPPAAALQHRQPQRRSTATAEALQQPQHCNSRGTAIADSETPGQQATRLALIYSRGLGGSISARPAGRPCFPAAGRSGRPAARVSRAGRIRVVGRTGRPAGCLQTADSDARPCHRVRPGFRPAAAGRHGHSTGLRPGGPAPRADSTGTRRAWRWRHAAKAGGRPVAGRYDRRRTGKAPAGRAPAGR